VVALELPGVGHPAGLPRPRWTGKPGAAAGWSPGYRGVARCTPWGSVRGRPAGGGSPHAHSDGHLHRRPAHGPPAPRRDVDPVGPGAAPVLRRRL